MASPYSITSSAGARAHVGGTDMTEEPQPTTLNAERGARSTCRERSETGSSPKNTKRNMCCSVVGEISWRYGETWQSVYGDLVLEFVKV